MKYIKKLLLFTSLLPCFVSASSIVSCAKKTVYNLTIFGGDKEILIDQSSGSNVSGISLNPWQAKINDILLAENSVIWELVDCDDPNIAIYNGYIRWLNPTLKNTTFKVRASFFVESLGKTITATSDEIHFYADPAALKIEFVNDDILAHTITATAGTAGEQLKPWFIKVNGQPYTGLKSPWKLVNSTGKEIQGLEIDSSNTIRWDKSLLAGYQELYFTTSIIDDATSKSYTICSSNNPIKLSVAKSKISLKDGNYDCYTPSGSTETIGSWKAYNASNTDITSANSTVWEIVNEGTTEFGNNISIDRGDVVVKDTLPQGNYEFKVIAIDESQPDNPTVISDLVKLQCYNPLVVQGGSKKFLGEIGTQGFVAQPWALYSGPTLVEDATFSITYVYKADEEKIKDLAKHIEFKDSPNSSNGAEKFLVWDATVPVGNYVFKVQCQKGDQIGYSDDITFVVTDPNKPCILLDGCSDTITAIKSTKKPQESVKSNKMESAETFEGKVKTPFVVTLFNGQTLDRQLLSYTITHTLSSPNDTSSLKFWVDQENCLCWSGLNEIDTLIHNEAILTVSVSYSYNGKILTDAKKFNFKVQNMSDGFVNVDGLSYNVYYGTNFFTNDDIYFPDSNLNNEKIVLKEGVDHVRWNSPTFDAKSKDCDLMFYNATIYATYNPQVQYQTIVVNVTVPKFSKITFNLHTKSIFNYNFARHSCNSDGVNASWRLQMFDFGTTKHLPEKISAYNNPIDYKSEKYAKEDTKFDQHFDGEGSFPHAGPGNISSEYQWKDIPIAFENNTNTEKTFKHYIGFSSSIFRGVWTDPFVCCRLRFTTNNWTLEAIK